MNCSVCSFYDIMADILFYLPYFMTLDAPSVTNCEGHINKLFGLPQLVEGVCHVRLEVVPLQAQ